MSNMSYCMFTNTQSDLADCETQLEALLSGVPDNEKLSEAEYAAACKLTMNCINIATMVAEAAGMHQDDMALPDIEAALSRVADIGRLA